MREAVGGSILFYIILGFVAVYIIFIVVIMNYAATYRASNYVVTTIEEYEGNVSVDSLKRELETKNYYNGLDISCQENSNGDAVYKVTTYVNFEVPLIGINGKIKINNETKAIYGVSCNQVATNQ